MQQGTGSKKKLKPPAVQRTAGGLSAYSLLPFEIRISVFVRNPPPRTTDLPGATAVVTGPLVPVHVLTLPCATAVRTCITFCSHGPYS